MVDEPLGPVTVEVELPTSPGPRIVVSLEVLGTPVGAEVVVLVVVEPDGEDGLIVVVDDAPPLSDGFCVVVVVVDCWARAGTARIRPRAAVAESRAVRILVLRFVIPEREETACRRGGS